MKSVTTVDIERYLGRVFFSLPRTKWGNRAQVTDAGALAEYLRLKAIEEREEKARKQAAKEGRNYTGAEVENGNGEKAGMLDGSSAVNANKKLVNPKEEKLKAVTDYMADIADQIIGKYRGVAQPSNFMRGVYVAPKEIVETVIEPKIREAQEKLSKELLPALAEEFPGMQDRARVAPLLKGGLGPLYDAADYPSGSDVAKRYSIDSAYLEIGVSTKISEGLRQKEEEKFKAKMENALQVSMEALRVSFAELIDHATEKLNVAPGEKPKVFRDSLIGNLQDFVNTFAVKNYGDSELEALVSKAQAIIAPGGQPLDPDRLRKFASVRDTVRAGFEQIKGQLDSMIVERKSRKIDVSED